MAFHGSNRRRPLTDEVRHALFRASENQDWTTMFALINDYHFLPGVGPENAALDDAGARDDFLKHYADRTLDAHRERWNKRIGGLLYSLGHSTPSGSSPDQGAEECFLADVDFRAVALENAYQNLIAEANKPKARPRQDGSVSKGIGSVNWASELVGVAWRECYLDLLLARALTDADDFFYRAMFAPHLPEDVGARRRRLARILELVEEAGGVDELAARLDEQGRGATGLRQSMLERLWAAYSGLLPKGRGGDSVDAVTLLLGLLSGSKNETWLAVQLLARDAPLCPRCGALFSTEEIQPEMKRLTPQRRRGRDRASDYELVCAACSGAAPQTGRPEPEAVESPALVAAAV